MGQQVDTVLLPVRLVLGIARLGEVDLRGWWLSHGLADAGEYVLSSILPRTWRMAALELDVLSASRRQDEMLGRPTALHLFSDYLPYRRWASAWLSEEKTREPSPLFDVLDDWTVENASTTLGEWCGPASSSGEHVGDGLCLGQLTAAELDDGAVLDAVVRALASAYLDQGDSLVAPYFDLVG